MGSLTTAEVLARFRVRNGKTCRKCGQHKPMDAFHRCRALHPSGNPRNPDGRRENCKACVMAAQAGRCRRKPKPVQLVRATELGNEAKCARCDEWWPQDREFFRDGVMVCRACEADRRAK